MALHKKNRIIFLPLIITAALYFVFIDKIRSTPEDAGFWIILSMGISIGVILRALFKK